MKSIYLFGLILAISCHQGKSDTTLSKENSVKELTKVDANHIISQIRKNVVIDGSIGVITTSDDYEFGDTIKIFDKRGHVQSNIVITDEYQELTLKCLSMNDSVYKVQYDENIIGYIPKNETKIIFHTWEEHVLSVFGVGFDIMSNPIRESPSDSSKKLNYEKDEFYHPVQIKGDWLKIKWGSESNWKYGWIKWKDGEKLLVELFYFA